MSETATTLESALERLLRRIVKEEIRAIKGELNGNSELLTPEQLADRLHIPISWIYEQSRQGNIPTHRLGRYIRFDLHEVLASQKKN